MRSLHVGKGSLLKSPAKKRHGIFLVSALFVTVVVTMYLVGAITLIPGGLLQSRNDGFRAQARQAAQSGVDYALARLRSNPLWRGDGAYPGNKAGTIVNQSGLLVVEDHGNVIGVIGYGSQDPAQFRLRFNYQDGTPGTEGLDDPASADQFDLNLISYNNLGAGIDNLAPQITGSNWSVVASPPPARLVPARSVWLSVQGRAGPGLRSLSLTNLNPPVSNGSISQVIVQTAYKPGSGSPAIVDAVTMSNSGIDAFLPSGLGNVSISSTLPGQTPIIRSNQGITVANGSSTANLASALGAQAHYLTSGGLSATTSGVLGVNDLAQQPFYQIGWAGVKQAASTAPPMAAGTYVVWQDGTVHYYDRSLSDYMAYMSNPVNMADVGSPAILPATMQMVPSGSGSNVNYNLQVTGDINVTGTSATNDLSVIPRSGAAQSPGAGNQPNQDQLASAIPNETDYYNGGPPNQATLYNAGSGLYAAFMDAVNAASTNSAMAATLGMTFTDSSHFSAGGMQFALGSPVLVNNNSGLPTGNVLPQFLAQLILMGATSGDISWLDNRLNIVPNPGGLISNNGGDTLSAANLSMTFAPTNTQGFAVISAPANISLGLGLGGAGGSIVSGGNVSLTGMGVNLGANPNAQQGVSLYSKGNININTFQQTGTNTSGVVGSFQDLNVKGVVYGWGNVTATLGMPSASTWGNFALQGALVSYGRDPSLGNPIPSSGSGQFSVTANTTNLKFDPAYLQNLMDQFPANVAMNRIFWSEQ